MNVQADTDVRPRILVLEDEPMILMELCFALEDEGAVPVSANSLSRAMDEIESTTLDAAVLDVNLGRNTTCEAAAQRLTELGVPFLLHSGDLMRQGELIARIGAEVVHKPSASSEVAGRVMALARATRPA